MSLKKLFRKGKDDDFQGVTLFGEKQQGSEVRSPDGSSLGRVSGRSSFDGSPENTAPSPQFLSEHIESALETFSLSSGCHFGKAISALSAEDFVKDATLIVPKLLHFLIAWLRNNGGFETEGIFRKPGRSELVLAARNVIEGGSLLEEDRLVGPAKDIGPLEVATLLLEYLKELPEKLLEAKRAMLLEAMACNNDKLLLIELRKVYLLLPKLHQDSITHLLRFLRDMISHESSTKTTSKNMAVCLEAVLFHHIDVQTLSATDRIAHGQQRVTLIKAMEMLINHSSHFQ